MTRRWAACVAAWWLKVAPSVRWRKFQQQPALRGGPRRCLLVEANPTLQVQIEAVHRRCHLLKGGLSTSTHESSFDFVMGGAVGGLADSVNEKKVREAQRRYKNIASGVVRVPCYPLRSVLAHMAQQQEMEAQSARLQPQPRAAVGGRLTVDFWSLDTEGSKPAILNATDFDAIEVGMLVVEHGANAAQRAAVLSVLHVTARPTRLCARQLPQHGRLLRQPRILRGAQDAAAFLRGHAN